MKQNLSACIVAITVTASIQAALQTADQPQEHVFRAGNGVSAPQLIKQVMPKYTLEALRRKIEGHVQIKAVVGTNGTVTDATIMKSLDSVYGLDEQALIAARQWQFKPGMKDNKPVPVVISIEMAFTVKK